MTLKLHPAISQLNVGETSPQTRGRIDTEWHAAACRQMQNMIPTVWGPGVRRPGSEHIAAVAVAADQGDLIPFEYSTVQAYMLEAADLEFRFFRDRGRLEVADTDGAISNGTFPSGITDWDDRSTGGAGNQISHDATNDRLTLEVSGTAAADIGWAEQDVTIDAAYTAVEHVLAFEVIGAAGDTVELQIGTSSTGAEVLGPVRKATGRHIVAFTPGATTFYVQFRNRGNDREKDMQIDNVSLLDNDPLSIVTPYAIADVAALRSAQSNDVLYLQHGSYFRRSLERLGDTTWALLVVPDEDGPYGPENVTGTTLTPGAATGLGVTLTASATTGINNDEGFKTTDVGRLVRLNTGGTWGWAVIVGHTSTTVVTVDIRSTLTDTTAKSSWRLGLYSDTDGHPTAAVFHDQRLALAGGGGAAFAGRVDLSFKGGFETFTPETDDDDAIALTLDSNGVNAVRWLVSARALLAGTALEAADVPAVTVRAAGVTRIGAATAGSALTPASAAARPEDVAAIYVERHGKSLRELRYDFVGTDSYVAEDLSIRAEHLGEAGGFTGLAYQPIPWRAIWVVRSDGKLICAPYEAAQSVRAFAPQIMGGAFQTGNPVVETARVIPGANGDELWLIVKRTINGATARHIEILADRFAGDTDQRDQWFVDAGLKYDVPVTVTGATQASPVVVTAAAHGFADGDEVILWDVLGMTELNGNTYTVANKATNTFELNDAAGAAIDGTGFTAYAAAGEVRKKVTTISGLTHVEGETVQILGDGATQTPKVVTGGAITLATPAATVIVGLDVPWILQPERFETPGHRGTIQTKPTAIARIGIRFWRTGGGVRVGTSTASADSALVPFGPPNELGEAVPLFTGDKVAGFPGSNLQADAPVVLSGSGPQNVAIQLIVPRASIEEDG